jgi:hypothetical protein
MNRIRRWRITTVTYLIAPLRRMDPMGTRTSLSCHCANDTNSQSSTDNDVTPRLGPPSFRMGRIVATRQVLAHLEKHGVLADPYLNRHVRGDWGMVPPEDAKANLLR